jgi:hypothetical protein
VKGEVGFFSGVTQLVFIDTVSKIGTGAVPTPVLVQDLDESTESELIRLNNVSLVTPSQWDTTGKASGFSCTITDGQNTWEIRIDEQTNIFKTNMAKPTGLFDVSGYWRTIRQLFSIHFGLSNSTALFARYYLD